MIRSPAIVAASLAAFFATGSSAFSASRCAAYLAECPVIEVHHLVFLGIRHRSDGIPLFPEFGEPGVEVFGFLFPKSLQALCYVPLLFEVLVACGFIALDDFPLFAEEVVHRLPELSPETVGFADVGTEVGDFFPLLLDLEHPVGRTAPLFALFELQGFGCEGTHLFELGCNLCGELFHKGAATEIKFVHSLAEAEVHVPRLVLRYTTGGLPLCPYRVHIRLVFAPGFARLRQLDEHILEALYDAFFLLEVLFKLPVQLLVVGVKLTVHRG